VNFTKISCKIYEAVSREHVHVHVLCNPANLVLFRIKLRELSPKDPVNFTSYSQEKWT